MNHFILKSSSSRLATSVTSRYLHTLCNNSSQFRKASTTADKISTASSSSRVNSIHSSMFYNHSSKSLLFNNELTGDNDITSLNSIRNVSTKRKAVSMFSDQFKQQHKQQYKQEQDQQQQDEYSEDYRNTFNGVPQPLEVKVVSNFSLFKTLLALALVGGAVYYYIGGNTSGGASGGGGIYSILAPRNYSSINKRPTETFDDVVGAEEAKSELQDLVDYLRNPGKYAERNIVTPKGILLVGPPGTGKTLLAKALAGEARIPFISINGSEFEEMFIGVGAKRVRELFAEARKMAPCIVFIDEIDSVGGSRSKRINYHPSDALNQLLVELDGFTGREGVIVLAATNFQETLDPALVRSGRFDRSIQVQLPDYVNTQILAQSTPGFSGADLFNLVNWAALDTTKNNQPEISMESLENAKENIIMGKERHSLILTDEARKICAYHEAGHALVAIKTQGAKDIHKATIMPRGDALGLVSMLQRDDFFQTKKQYLAEMDVAMGGRAAEELILGDENISQGASSDIKKATSIAKQMVMKLGMSDEVGKIYIDSEKKLSPQQREMVDREVKKFLDQSYDRARKLLEDYSAEHHLLAKALIEYETLNLDEIMAIIEKRQLPKTKKNRDALIKDREDKDKKRQEEMKKVKPIAQPVSTRLTGVFLPPGQQPTQQGQVQQQQQVQQPQPTRSRTVFIQNQPQPPQQQQQQQQQGQSQQNNNNNNQNGKNIPVVDNNNNDRK
ncbi:Putative FtsH protease [Cavenderia fasciculata]|uniref:FtsH protease n=1 Tax=Cavenderia fasciculata TaxID=261658 RepID=F4Q989_CACFS|nr:Putative FtsH protease [Cavenderia fasciculata]EGG15258.1 Putative FtsH protease [Cavenderia fasciculata]|eukprot:XP_004351978.1 Putative FtsH protease [Cavenderia fasciculata]